MSQPAVHIEGLYYRYPGQEGFFIENLNLHISQGARFGLFGPNGAGKTTLMHLMAGILRARKGSIDLMGVPLGKNGKTIRQQFGLVPQDFSFYAELSPWENLAFFAAWYGLRAPTARQRAEEILVTLGLWDVKDKPVKQFSGGMKRRVNLAIAVLHRPPLLFLDEPTVGVDVQSRHAMIDYLKGLNAAGTTLIYTSHQLSEAEDLCHNVALMDQGRIIVHGELDVLLTRHGQQGLESLFLQLTGKAYRD